MALLSLVVLSLFAQRGIAPQPPPGANLEYQVKAAYILNFLSFVEWPDTAFETASTPFRLCVVGSDPFGGALEGTMKGESFQGHAVVVERVAPGEAAPPCQLLFVPASAEAADLLRTTVSAPILTIGESDGFLRNGGVVAFVIEQGHVRFDVNRASAERRGLKLSSRLLRVARNVK